MRGCERAESRLGRPARLAACGSQSTDSPRGRAVGSPICGRSSWAALAADPGSRTRPPGGRSHTPRRPRGESARAQPSSHSVLAPSVLRRVAFAIVDAGPASSPASTPDVLLCPSELAPLMVAACRSCSVSRIRTSGSARFPLSALASASASAALRARRAFARLVSACGSASSSPSTCGRRRRSAAGNGPSTSFRHRLTRSSRANREVPSPVFDELQPVRPHRRRRVRLQGPRLARRGRFARLRRSGPAARRRRPTRRAEPRPSRFERAGDAS